MMPRPPHLPRLHSRLHHACGCSALCAAWLHTGRRGVIVLHPPPFSSLFTPSAVLRSPTLLRRTAPIDYDAQPCPTRYKLYAAVFHSGYTVRSGHYFA